MAVIGLLLIALVCLILGLILQSSGWLVASLIATGGAAFLLHKLRTSIATTRRSAPTETSVPEQDAETAAQAHPESDAAPAESAASDAALDGAGAVGPLDGGEPERVGVKRVWVIDGRPRYHLGDCAIIKGQDAEEIPFDQATEDGFMPCSLCEPHAVRVR